MGKRVWQQKYKSFDWPNSRDQNRGKNSPKWKDTGTLQVKHLDPSFQFKSKVTLCFDMSMSITFIHILQHQISFQFYFLFHVKFKLNFVYQNSFLSDGAKRCGPFCAVYNALEQIMLDGEVDLFTITRQLQTRRSEFLSSFVRVQRNHIANVY